MIEVAASKSFTPASAPPREKRISPFVWLNLVCLDAPLVAVSWHWLFADVFQIAIPRGTTAALFLTAWLIYLTDRFVDSVSLDQRTAISLRQRFCRRHRAAWIVGVSAVALADLVVVWRELDTLAVLVGCGVGGLASVYLLINQLRPSIWRLLPLKEISIGAIFAAGAMVGLLRGLPTVAFAPWIVFASLCALNCICIAFWELGLDLAQRRISIATEFPQVNRLVVALFATIWLTSGFLTALLPSSRSVSMAIGASATLLALVHVVRDRIQADTRTALADLLLLTPVVFLLLR